MQVVAHNFVEKAIEDADGIYLCTDFHQGMSCNQKALIQFISTSRSCSKMYFLVHLIPLILFKRKKISKNPAKELRKFLIGFLKSLLFAGGYTCLVRRIVCLVTQHHKFAGYSNVIGAIFAGGTLCFETKSRQTQIALYCLNKAMQVTYLMAKRRNLIINVPFSEHIFLALGLALICHHYFNNNDSVREAYKKILNLGLQNC